MANTRITEKKWCDVHRSNCENPVFLAWVNELRGVDYWLFEGNRQIIDEDRDSLRYEQSYTDLAGTSTVTGVVSKSANRRYVLNASHLTEQQYEGLIWITRSKKVLVLMNPSTWETEDPVWQEVNVLSSSHDNEDTSLKQLTITVELQPILTVKK